MAFLFFFFLGLFHPDITEWGICKKINILYTITQGIPSYRHCKEKKRTNVSWYTVCIEVSRHCGSCLKTTRHQTLQPTLFQHPGTGKPSSPWQQKHNVKILQTTNGWHANMHSVQASFTSLHTALKSCHRKSYGSDQKSTFNTPRHDFKIQF